MSPGQVGLPGRPLSFVMMGERGGFRPAMANGFDAVYERHGRAVHAYLARLVGDAAAAEDLCQDTFVRYLEHERALAGRNGHVGPWLFRVATNLALDRLRRRRPSALVDTSAPPAPPDAREVDPDADALVRAAVSALEPGLRAAFLLRVHHGLTFPEIALVLALSERGAKDRYRRARDELAQRLSPWLEDLLP